MVKDYSSYSFYQIKEMIEKFKDEKNVNVLVGKVMALTYGKASPEYIKEVYNSTKK